MELLVARRERIYLDRFRNEFSATPKRRLRLATPATGSPPLLKIRLEVALRSMQEKIGSISIVATQKIRARVGTDRAEERSNLLNRAMFRGA